MSNELVLFDLPSKGRCACWSLNPWKTRAALNFKGIDYRTEWVEYPNMAARFKSFGISATAEKSPSGWSIPAVRMPDDTYIMDSRKIADALEILKPEPSLQLDSEYVQRTQKIVQDAQDALTPVVIPKVPAILLNQPSAEYFYETRKVRFGMSLPELAKSPQGGEVAWKSAEPALQALAGILHENDGGPFVLGEQASYPDMILAGYWAFLKKLDEDDIFERMMGIDAAFRKHWEAVQVFLKRDD